MKKDITTREDIEMLMNNFYEKLLSDNNINYIFTNIANLDIKRHIPVIADFWESILLNKNVYHNNIMNIHMDLNKKSRLTKMHFDIWLKHFILQWTSCLKEILPYWQSNVPNQ